MAYVTLDVDVDLDKFDSGELAAELEKRGFTVTDGELDEDMKKLFTRIWLADREGRKDEAYALMREYVFEKLGKVI